MSDLFRKEAMESFSSNSEMGKGVRAVSIKTVVFAGLLIICTAVFAIWLTCGTIYETVSVNGVIWPAENNGTVYAVSSGVVSVVTVSEGGMVSAGDLLAIIPQEDILSQIEEGKANGMEDAELEKLYHEYDKYSMIRSNIAGIVTYVADENSYLWEGGIAAAVVPYDESGNNLTLTAFVPSDTSGLVALGMEAQVMPDFAPREEYGYIKAYISGISSYPVTGESIKDTNSELFLSSLDERESYLQIEITLIPDAEAASHLKWSNPKSGSTNVAMGTVCTVDIITTECRPYEWLFRTGV